MKLRLLIRLSLFLVCTSQAARAATPLPMPALEDYTFMWWAHGWGANRAPTQPQVLCVQTGRYGMALDVQTAQLTHLGPIGHAAGYATAAAQDNAALFALPKGDLSLAVQVGAVRYHCILAAQDQKDSANFPVRWIDSGRWVQRADLLHLQFADDHGATLAAEGRLEIIAWPDRLGFILELTPQQVLAAAQLAIAVGGQRQESPVQTLQPGQPCQVATALEFGAAANTPADPAAVQAVDLNTPNQACPVEYDTARGWYRAVLPATHFDVGKDLDHLDRIGLTLTNPTGTERTIRLFCDAPAGQPGMPGFCPMLRDQDGVPTGIPVQLSKNWHQKQGRTFLYQGPWFHGFSMVRLPPNTVQRLELAITHARWGGVFAASHAQLCLIGWGWNQLWDQAAIGAFGENICYEPDGVQVRCLIDDVRPLLVWNMRQGNAKAKWGWTNNVGGGDFLVYYNGQGEYQRLTRMHAAYLSQGPNLTDVVYAGISADGHIAARIEVSTPRCDDINRAFHRFRYDVRTPTPISRLAFYQVGSDGYHWHQYQTMARGNEAGLTEEWQPQRGGGHYLRTGMDCPGRAPWFSLHQALPGSPGEPATGGWANRGLVIRSWKARLGAKEVPPYASVFGTQANNLPSANLELSAPPDVKELLPGDFVDAEVELVIMPLAADDYYGPNENLRAALAAGGNTWRPIQREALGNDLKIRLSAGTLARRYPVVVGVDEKQSADLEITGGVGYVPITFTGLNHAKPRAVLLTVDGKESSLNQAVYGNDFWQTDFDAALGTWSQTYNINLDSPGDRPRAVRVRLAPP